MVLKDLNPCSRVKRFIQRTTPFLHDGNRGLPGATAVKERARRAGRVDTGWRRLDIDQRRLIFKF